MQEFALARQSRVVERFLAELETANAADAGKDA